MRYCGIDEAGLGPLLGPLVAASCTSSLPPEQLLSMLKSLGFWPEPVSQGVSVADSKQIYRIYRGNFARLEQLALSLYLSCAPTGLQIPLQNLLPEQLGELEWYRELWQQPVFLPLLAEAQKVWEQAVKLGAALRQRGGILQLSAVLLTEREFNQKIAQWDNKSLVLRELIGSLIRAFVRELRPSLEAIPYCVVDRLGGLKYYRPWLCTLFGTKTQRPLLEHSDWDIQTQSESPSISEYWLYNGKQDIQLGLGFWVKGDQHNILCAIASIWAKYLRELLMQQFNRYWHSRFPKAPTTSGYYRDATIFLDYLQQGLGSLPPDLRRQR